MASQGFSLLIVVIVFLLICYVIAKAIKVGVDSATTKQCPACAERVKSAATKCRYCGTELESGEPELNFKAKGKPPWQ